MDDDEVFEAVRAAAAKHGVSELTRVITFKGCLTNEHGSPVEVTIDVHDSGDPSDNYRWNVKATDERGRFATGNGARDLNTALLTTHWHELESGRS